MYTMIIGYNIIQNPKNKAICAKLLLRRLFYLMFPTDSFVKICLNRHSYTENTLLSMLTECPQKIDVFKRDKNRKVCNTRSKLVDSREHARAQNRYCIAGENTRALMVTMETNGGGGYVGWQKL